MTSLDCRANARGFTLVELVVTIGIIAILLGMATLPFSQWLRKYGIESQTRQLFADLQDARSRAMFSKRPTRITLNPQAYLIEQAVTDYDTTIATHTTVMNITTKRTMTLENGGALSNTMIVFDSYGMADTQLNIRVNPVDSGAVDCVIIDTARSIIGGVTSGSCVPK